MVDFLQVVIVVTLLLIVWGAHRSRFQLMQPLTQLRDELKSHFPVYSAETTRGKEAEFIRDRLPKRVPLWVLFVTIVVLGAVAAWLVR
jgi:type VI protein secretion system component VasF